jgi:serine/threonine protein kinase
MIPIKWSAPEVLEKRKYSSKSDIWSFGIICGKFFFWKKPYPDLNNKEAAEKIFLEGYRMPNPNENLCPNEIYSIMLDCWKKEANERPNFQQIYEKLN